MESAGETVQAYRDALAAGDFTAMRARLDDKLLFRGPFDTFTSPEPYLESLAKLRPIIVRIEPLRTFVDGDDVCVLYNMVTSGDVSTSYIAEWYQASRGRITAIRVVFDPRPFAAMFSK